MELSDLKVHLSDLLGQLRSSKEQQKNWIPSKTKKVLHMAQSNG